MTTEWVLLDVGNTLLELDYERLLSALDLAGFAASEAGIRAGEAATRPAMERLIFDRWLAGDIPHSGWIEARVWGEFWGQVLLRAGAPPRRLEALVETTLGITRPATNWNRLTPGAIGSLDELADRGIRLGVISNSDGSVAAQLAALGLADRFEFILDSGHVGIEKPHPEIFRRALSLTGGADPRRVVYVGDVYAIDVAGSSSAGLRPILFDPNGLYRARDYGEVGPACAVLRAMEDLPAQVSV